MNELIYLVQPAVEYAELGQRIEALEPRATEGSTSLFDYNRMLVQRRALWMRINGLGPR